MSEESPESLAGKIKEIVQEAWAAEAKPVLLSNLGMELRRNGVDYKSITSGKSLSAFISERDNEFKVVQHPKETLKLGVIPAGEDFEFKVDAGEEKDGVEVEAEAGPISRHAKNAHVAESRRALYAFIHQLSKLPASERDGVNIPVNVLIRLMEGK
ncbi:hypothetical protein [Rhodovulum sp. MB263]|uniref:hypothetical protein n=1 Tax=Rhodovulum sp. (strain MB263) TaxID=308754 RepID=UPI0012DB4D1A|nr:hypothetical protein [Rhodovulum sp. MB263]